MNESKPTNTIRRSAEKKPRDERQSRLGHWASLGGGASLIHSVVSSLGSMHLQLALRLGVGVTHVFAGWGLALALALAWDGGSHMMTDTWSEREEFLISISISIRLLLFLARIK
jgi:hypothetical protein